MVCQVHVISGLVPILEMVVEVDTPGCLLTVKL